MMTSFSSNLKKEIIPYQMIFKKIASTKIINLLDNISNDKNNTKLIIAYSSKNEIIGYARAIVTTTGCNSKCLPLFFTLFYNKNKKLIKITSAPGLTKKNHVMFTQKDYRNLELILDINPSSFLKVKYPRQMVDVISSATKKEYQKDVIKNAAFSTLRINLYNQDILLFLKKLNLR